MNFTFLKIFNAKYSIIIVLGKYESRGFFVQLGLDILEFCCVVWLFTISLKCSSEESFKSKI